LSGEGPGYQKDKLLLLVLRYLLQILLLQEQQATLVVPIILPVTSLLVMAVA
jgi:hypothetical protein